MTERTATTGASADEVEKESAGHAPTGEPTGPEGAATPDGEHGSDEQTVVGRAAVRSDSEAGGEADRPLGPGAVDADPRGPGSVDGDPGGPGSGGDATASMRPASDLTAATAALSSTPRPTFTRPPGMAPPPVRLDEGEQSEATRRIPAGVGVPAGGIKVPTSTSGAYPVISGTAPVSAPPRGSARPGGGGGMTMRPISPEAAVGAAKVGETTARSSRSTATPRGPRRARLGVKRIDPWSVMKFSFAVSVVLFIVMIVAASVLYLALDTMGVFASINTTLADLVESGGGTSGETFQITARGVIGTAGVLGAINVVLFTALATLGAFIYNVCADLVGGVELTLAERD